MAILHSGPQRTAQGKVGPRAVLLTLLAEFAGVSAAVRRTSVGSWLGFGVVLAIASTVGILPLGAVALVLQVAGFLLVSAFVVWPDIVARVMREDDALGIRERNSAVVVAYLPVAVALFSLPFYLVAQASLFRRVMVHFPDALPGSGWGDAWRLSIDNLLFTELFLDVFDVLGVGLAGDSEHLAGRIIVFVTRLLLSVGFVRVAVSMLRSAYYRAHALGRGSDALAELDEAVSAGDAVQAGHLGREIANDARGTVDVVVNRLLDADADDPVRRDHAYRSLRALRDWAIPALRLRSLHGDPRSGELDDLVADLTGAWAADAPPLPRRRPARVAAVAAVAFILAALLVWAPAQLAFVVGAAAMLTLVWLLASPRATYEALMEGGVAPYVPLESLRRATLVCSTVLAVAFLLVSWATIWHAVTLWPGSFEAVRGPFGPGAVLGFLGSSVIRVQAFLSLPDVFRVGEPAIEQRPWIGSILTLTLRTGLNLGFVAVVVTALSVGRDREGFSGLLNVPDDLGMRMEALRGGRYAVRLVGHHAERVGERLWGALDAAGRADVQDALASSGAFDWLIAYDTLTKPGSPQRLRSQAAVIEAIQRQGWGTSRWVEDLDSALADGEWPVDVCVQVRSRRAVMAARQPDVSGAVEALETAYAQLTSGPDPLDDGAGREARAVWSQSAHSAASILPPAAIAGGVAMSLVARALGQFDGLAAVSPDRFAANALRSRSLMALIRARSEGATVGFEELSQVVKDAVALPPTHPWRESSLHLLLGAASTVSAIAEAAGIAADPAGADLELRLSEALGGRPSDLIDAGQTERAYDPWLGEELVMQTLILSGLPATRTALRSTMRAAALFEAHWMNGVMEARTYAIAMGMFAAQTAHKLNAHDACVEAAEAAFRIIEGMRVDWPVTHLLANTYAYCAIAQLALGDDETAVNHAATAKSLFERIAESGWEGAQEATRQGSELLVGFET